MFKMSNNVHQIEYIEHNDNIFEDFGCFILLNRKWMKRVSEKKDRWRKFQQN